VNILSTTKAPAELGEVGFILARIGEQMIRAILKKGKIEPLNELPGHWRDGQELIVEGGEPSDDPAEIKKWHEKLPALSAQIPAEDHKRMAAALAEQDRQSKSICDPEANPDRFGRFRGTSRYNERG
jgi:hypothetical protein